MYNNNAIPTQGGRSVDLFSSSLPILMTVDYTWSVFQISIVMMVLSVCMIAAEAYIFQLLLKEP